MTNKTDAPPARGAVSLTYRMYKPRKDGMRKVVVTSTTGSAMTWWTVRSEGEIKATVAKIEERLQSNALRDFRITEKEEE